LQFKLSSKRQVSQPKTAPPEMQSSIQFSAFVMPLLDGRPAQAYSILEASCRASVKQCHAFLQRACPCSDTQETVMPAPAVIRVRVCADCGNVCNSMETRCPACLRHGTLANRYQCTGCNALLDERTCSVCQEETRLRSGLAEHPVPGLVVSNESEPLPPLADPLAAPPWLVGAIGGAILGSGIGALTGHLLGETWWLGALLGLVPGILAGALLSGDKGPRPL
jgi:hypothetical protein